MTVSSSDIQPRPDSPRPEAPGAIEYGYWTFILVAVGRVGELIPGLQSVPLAKIALAVPLLLALVRRNRLPALAPQARPLARNAWWLVAICLVLTPFSAWPGATRTFVLQELPVLISTVFLAYVMGRSWRTLRGTLTVLVLTGLLLARAALAGYTGGRAATNTMYDTNDLAYLLVTVFPISIGFLLTSKTKLRWFINAGVGAILLGALLLTQSRGGLLALLAVVVLLIFAPIRARVPGGGKGTNRLLVLLGVMALGLIAWSQLPPDARARFATVLDLGNDYNLDPNDVTSRGQIWTRGFHATLARPIGYAPRTFNMVEFRYGGDFYAPHNSIVQAMVELGVPGLLLFVRMYLLSWRGLQRARKDLLVSESPSADQQEQVIFARMLQITLVGNFVAGFFLSMAYATVLWTTLGLSMAMMALTHRENPPGAVPQAS
jgi:putative inorganic carbon (hco3(-)) transporter